MSPPVEFLDDGDAAARADRADEASDPAPANDTTTRRFVRRPVVWVIAAVVALAGGWALLRPHGAPDAGPIHITPPPVSRSWEIGPPYPRPQPPFGSCPRYAMCVQTPQARASLAAAVRRQFPRARLSRVATVERRWSGAVQPVLVRRTVAAATDSAQLRVVVGVDTPVATKKVASPAGPAASHRRVAHFSAEAAGFVIDVFWTGPAGTPVPQQRMRRLAEDPTLVLTD
jgi:hypothetical protein